MVGQKEPQARIKRSYYTELGEMVDFRARQGRHKMVLEHAVIPEIKEVLNRKENTEEASNSQS